MKIRRKALAIILVLAMIFSIPACGSNEQFEGYTGEYKVCMISDAGDITDQSFNQTTYEAIYEWCTEHNVPFTYKKPESETDNAAVTMVDLAIAEGYNVIILPGYKFATTIVEVSDKYPEVKFIGLDISEGDLIAAAVGNVYYSNPEAYDVKDYYNTENTYCAIYKEEIPGYLAGYTAVRLGYRNLGFLGGQEVAAVMRYGYGYLQGIDDAAEELGVSDQIHVNYAYGGLFYGTTEITAVMDTWYSKGTEVVFACGGGIYTSAASAAQKTNGKLIGTDTDQSPVIDVYGEGMTVTSAMKSLTATVYAMLDSIIIDNTWDQHVGKIESLGLVSGSDTELNYVGLPEDTTQWNEDFTVDDYKELVRRIYEGEITIDNSVDKVPDVSYDLDVRDGSIM